MANYMRRIREEEEEKLATVELEFVQNQLQDEERRREAIEGKTGQLLGQASIVVSVISLFIPLISDQINNLNLCEKIISIIIFLVVVITFSISIWIASSSWVINRYGYDSPELKDISNPTGPNSKYVFIQRHKEILSKVVKQHIDVNNEKGTQLIRAAVAFRTGIVLLGILVVSLSILFASQKDQTKKMEIQNPIKVDIQDSLHLYNKWEKVNH